MKNNPCLFSYLENGVRFTWEITERCNFGCRHCCVNATSFRKEELSVDRALVVLDEMKKANVKALYISGGEPLLYKGLFNILKKASQYRMKINLATNGSFISKEKASYLAKCHLNSILVSLDGYNKETHNKFRNNPYAFQKAVYAIKTLVKVGIKVKIGVIIWRENVEHLEDMIRLAICLKAYKIYFSWIIVVGRSIYNKDILVPKDKFTSCARQLKQLKDKYKDIIKISYKRFIPLTVNADNCPGANKLFHLDAKGYIYPCSWMAKVYPIIRSSYSVKEKPLNQLLNSPKLKEFRKMILSRKEKFGPGCPALCFLNNKKFNSVDPLYK